MSPITPCVHHQDISTMDRLVRHYETEIVEPGCAPGSGQYGLRIMVVEEISPVLPYINALADNAWYDPENQTLILKETGQSLAFRPHEIRVARLAVPALAREISHDVVEKVNSIWAERDRIEPRFTTRRLPSVIDILKLLPRTNCRQCGHGTCLAFAAALRSSQAEIGLCIPLAGASHAARRNGIAELCAPPAKGLGGVRFCTQS